MSATVLLIEDYSAHRALLQTVVSRLGCQSLEAADGRTGLALAAERQPAMIVLDLLLPDLDGLEVLRRLKADPGTAALPVLIVSAVEDQARVIEALEAGAEDYVTKPFCSETLQARMRAILRTARLQRDLELRARQAELSARIAGAAAGGDLETVCAEVARALEQETGAGEARLYLMQDDQVRGPLAVRGVEPTQHALVRLLQQPGLGKLLCGEVPWQRLNASELGPLGRGLEDAAVVALPIRTAERAVALALLSSRDVPLRDGALRRVGELVSSAALALSATSERTGREELDRRYRLLFDQSGDGVAVLEPLSGVCREANQTLAGWLSAMPLALQGRPFASFFAPEVTSSVAEAIRTAAQGQRLVLDSLTLADGSTTGRPVIVEFRRIRHTVGSEVVAVVRDLQNQQALRDYRQKAADLQRLARTVRALNHEINNPLTCIIGLTQLLQIRLEGHPDYLPQLGRVLESAEQITTFTRQLREAAVALAGDEPLDELDELLGDLPASGGV